MAPDIKAYLKKLPSKKRPPVYIAYKYDQLLNDPESAEQLIREIEFPIAQWREKLGTRPHYNFFKWIKP